MTVVDQARGHGAPPWRRLVRSELHRLTAPPAVRRVAVALPLLTLAFGLSKLFTHSPDTGPALRESEARYREFLDQAARTGMPTGTIGRDNFFDDPRYLMESLSFGDLRTVLLGLCVAATVFGIVGGGADWASRVMLTLTAAEPRRARLFLTRGLLAGGLSMAVTALCGLLLVPCLLLAARFRGSTAGLDATYWAVLSGQLLRGTVLVGLLALLGYSLAAMTRHVPVALAVVFGYLAGAGWAFEGRGPRLAEYDMDGLTFAVLNEKPVIPMAESDCVAGPGCEAVHVDLTSADGFAGILLYLLPVLLLALWRATRTDVG
ncbi:hypothetical protein [Streptomyces sp. NBC_00525]|uniref:hypothetical protein n=1 Tax=Streptomyces sp. NBC_00525 TaxID=2903660 RepID=UPI002E82305A|nr:hypothetical protein [Streptomyces sp. NBC_00525]WUC95076.1 hypothetical protein OG710_16445 [Streptomyces sp. NBC_00525]